MFLPAVFYHRPFVAMWVGRFLTNIATSAQGVAVGWLVYTVARLTHDERQSMLFVGLIGLAQFLPMFALALIAGETADRYDRRKILFVCGLLQVVGAAIFTLLSMQHDLSLALIFVVAALFGSVRAFASPAMSALLSALVPREVLPKAVAWNSLSVHGGMVLGPWVGGILCSISPAVATGTACVLFCLASVTGVMLLLMPIDARPPHNPTSRLVMIREGLAYLWGSKVVLGAISLDMFAVLLGGVTALLPAYAKDVLDIGPEGFGYLRSSFGGGGAVMTLLLAFAPIRRHAGAWMLGGVLVYGLAIFCFALSRQLPLSMLALAIAGLADSISVFVRQNLVQIVVPDALRGRVSAVSGLFISASNELGEFESGLAARLLGVVGSAVFGGVGSMAITGLWARLFPALRRADRLEPSKS